MEEPKFGRLYLGVALYLCALIALFDWFARSYNR
jgi:hypothetical protein